MKRAIPFKNYELKIRRLSVHEQPPGYGSAITQPQDVAGIARELIGDNAQESFIALLLDIKNRVVGVTEVARGAVDGCGVDVRQVFRVAIAVGASALVVAHNHPSGDCTPSDVDRRLTERIKKAADLLGIPLLDHVIVSDTGFKSLQTLGFFQTNHS